MTAERDLLRALREAIGSGEVDTVALVDEAWDDAREEVHATLKRLIAHDLLRRALETLGGRDIPDAITNEEPGVTARDLPSPLSDAAPDVDPSAASSMTYLFGIVGPDVRLPADELPTLPGGGELRLLEGPGCRAVVSYVDAQLFEVLREPGPDGLELLSAAARAHDAILASFANEPVLPLGLGTALADDAAVQRLIAEHAPALQLELARIGDHAEWSVTVHASERLAPDDAAPDAPASGREYLQQRRAARNAREDRWESQERLAENLHAPLAACAREAQRVESRPLEDDAPPLMHGVYLLDRASYGRFESTITYLRTEYPDAVIEVSGPWPPYHFVSLNLAVENASNP